MKLSNLGKNSFFAQFGNPTRTKSDLSKYLLNWPLASCFGQSSFFILDNLQDLFKEIIFSPTDTSSWKLKEIVFNKKIKVVINNSIIEEVIPLEIFHSKNGDYVLFKIKRIKGYFLSKIKKGELSYISPLKEEK